MTVAPGTPENLGEHNRKLILDCVRKHGPLSRAELSRKLDMSFPTISSNVNKLLDSCYLREAGIGSNSIGRKSTLLAFNATWGYIIGADIGRSQIRVMLTDLEGKEIAYLKQDYRAQEEENAAEECLIRLIETAIRDGGIKPSQVKYISLGIPGIMDPKTGQLILVPFMPRMDIKKVVQRIASIYHAPVVAENSVNLSAIGEKWKGAAKSRRNILYFSYGVGIGAALILNGELFKGANNTAGEVGYMVPDPAMLRGCFDEQGVLETLVSGSTIQERMLQHGLGQDFGKLMEEDRNKNPAARELLGHISLYIGIMLINIASVIDVELIVIGGRLGDLIAPSLIASWQDVLSKHVPFPPEILTSTLRDKASVLGGIAIGMRQISDALVGQDA